MSEPSITEREKRYRDAGIHPDEVPPPDGPVRTSLGRWTVVGQGCGTAGCGLVGLGGLVLAACSWLIPSPEWWTALVGGLVLALIIAFVIYHVTKNDYLWLDIDGRVVSAKHLYTGRLVVREVTEVREVRTLVLPGAAAWFGRVKGFLITFKDGRAPLQVVRTDPAMKNACLFMEALLFEMKTAGPVKAEVINLNGAPIVMRVYWDRKGTKPDRPEGPPDDRLRKRP